MDVPALRKGSVNCRVLIVEDEATIARNCVTFFELQGYSVDIAHDGAAAVARLASDTFDVVVLDLGLPRLDGKRVLDHLRRELSLATPVLILTARDELESKLACFALGADDYLAKPFSLAELEARVQHCIDGRPVRSSKMLRSPESFGWIVARDRFQYTAYRCVCPTPYAYSRLLVARSWQSCDACRA